MAYDAKLATRIDRLLSGRAGLTRKAMFGGLVWLLHGNICVGIWKDALIARVGADDYVAALREYGVREFNVTGRAMTGWVLVRPDALESEADLRQWTDRCLRFVGTLPRKGG